jgi:uncharacterized membrane protein YeaQ/YmgE (transglycosylase-associated protein family)
MKDYIAIPGLGTGRNSFRIAMRHRLYQAADHLLLVQSTGFTDDYRRLYYRDIGHVVARRTQRQMVLGIVLGVVAAFTLGIALYAWSQGFAAAAIPVAMGGAVMVLLFVVNILRGPTCVCYITTQVQTVEVPTPQRLAKVALLIDFLRERTAGETGPVISPQA